MQKKCSFPFVLFLLFVVMLGLPTAALAQDDSSSLTFILLDEQEQPRAGVEMSLTVFRYGDSGVERISAGSCTTGEDGRCSFTIADTPRLASGQAEASLEVVGIGSRRLAWEGNEATFTLYASDLSLAATLSVPIEQGYENTETLPPDAPTGAAPTRGSRRTPVVSTATRTPSATPSPKATVAENTPTTQSTETIPAEADPPRRASLSFSLLLLCGLVLFVALGMFLWKTWQRQHEKGQGR